MQHRHAGKDAQEMADTLLRPAELTTAFLKAGILGFAGSGKTYTAVLIMLGLAKDTGKPVAFFDTEQGSDWVKPMFDEAGVQLLVAKTRAFTDLLQFMREADDAGCIGAIVDSISHVWTELLEAYTTKLRRTAGLEFQDWGKIKPEWRQFTDAYLNAPMHCILCGRAGYEYEMGFNEETGKKELWKTGTKMKAETEMSYEPSLLLEMVRVQESRTTHNPDDRGVTHRCYVLKDRSQQMDGREIDNPTFESFAPILERINLGGKHLAIDTDRSSADLFESPASRIERRKQLDIALDLIKDAITEAGIGGTAEQAKKTKIRILREAFGTSSWTEIQNMQLEALQEGRAKLAGLIAKETAQ